MNKFIRVCTDLTACTVTYNRAGINYSVTVRWLSVARSVRYIVQRPTAAHTPLFSDSRKGLQKSSQGAALTQWSEAMVQ